MLKAQELRVGNLVLINGLRTEVSLLVLKHLLENNIQFTVEGIPLSEEILLKFGFVDNGLSFSGCKIYEIGVFRLFYHKLNKTYAMGHQQMSPPSTVFSDIEYLHQLQNLYFALTGKELNTSEFI